MLSFMKNANTFNCKHPNCGTSTLTLFWSHKSVFAPELGQKIAYYTGRCLQTPNVGHIWSSLVD